MNKFLLIAFLLFTGTCFSQKDTVPAHGTIKVSKVKPGEVYIKAYAKFTKYDLSEVKGMVTPEVFQPFPVVDGYPYPFNYTKYYEDSFESKAIDLKGKELDSVTLEVIVLAGGKVYIKDKSKTMMMKGVPVTYDEKKGAYEINNLHVNCINFLKMINGWFPAYILLPKKDRFRGEVVIKPNKKNVDCSGTVTIVFSTTPFDE